MPRRNSPLCPFGRGASHGLLPLALAAAACIDTHLDDPDVSLPCSRAIAASAGAQSVVWLSADLGDLGNRYCTGVVVAPRLVLTSFTCVTYPADVDTETLQPEDPRFPRPSLDYFDPRDFECDSNAAWVPIEDGSFTARFGGVLPSDALTIGLVGATSAASPVERVEVAATSSRCTEGVALLVLRDSLVLAPAPLRMVDLDSVGEETLMSSARAVGGRFDHESLEMRIEAVTDYPGTADTPPRSLRLAPSACPYERGAGVLSVNSGALIAIVSSGESERCGDTGGDTLAVRLTPFREMLLDSSARYGQTLVAEQHASTPDKLRTCP